MLPWVDLVTLNCIRHCPIFKFSAMLKISNFKRSGCMDMSLSITFWASFLQRLRRDEWDIFVNSTPGYWSKLFKINNVADINKVKFILTYMQAFMLNKLNYQYQTCQARIAQDSKHHVVLGLGNIGYTMFTKDKRDEVGLHIAIVNMPSPLYRIFPEKAR